MKRMILSMAALVLLVTVTGFAKGKTVSTVTLSDNSIESLMIGVESENMGLKTSSASVLGQFKTSKAVIPLMKDLKENNDERVRLQAAVALWKIGDPRGIYAIKQAVKFDESERVKRICSILYLDTIDSSKTRF